MFNVLRTKTFFKTFPILLFNFKVDVVMNLISAWRKKYSKQNEILTDETGNERQKSAFYFLFLFPNFPFRLLIKTNPLASEANVNKRYCWIILMQRFSTWGTRTPRGTQAVCRGYAKFVKPLKRSLQGVRMGRIFWLGVRKWDTTLIWGYAEG